VQVPRGDGDGKCTNSHVMNPSRLAWILSALSRLVNASQEMWAVARSGELSNASLARFETHMRVLISGAGPAGLTAAYWLRRYGFSPTIVERAPSLLVGGYKIDVRGAALQALRHMGVHDAVVAAHTDMQGAVLVDKEGNVVN